MDTDMLKGHRERLRKRFLNTGIDSLHDYEIVELLLTFIIPRRDVKPLAKELLQRFRSLSGILDAPVSDLRAVAGIGENAAAMLHFIRPLCGAYLAEQMREVDVITSPQSVRDYARMSMAGLPEEAFMVIYLNIKNHVIAHEIIIRGTVDQSAVYPRNIVKNTLHHNASGLVLVHNHPSGICDPSRDDIRLTDAIKAATHTINVKVIDHIIVGKGGYFSFVESGLLSR